MQVQQNTTKQSNLVNLFSRYLTFDTTGSNTIHTINNFNTEGYEQYIDIICHSTIISTQPYSRKILRIIYTNADPTIEVSSNTRQNIR